MGNRANTVVNTPPFDIDGEWEAGAGTLALSGELDLATVPLVEEAVEAMLARAVRRLTLDLGGLGFMDSSGLRLLIVLAKRASAEGWTLALTRATEPVRALLRVSGVEGVLPFVESSGPA
jgi:anti-sigma B factor antagonist